MEDSDQAEPFRQRRPFYYLTGCNLPDCRYMYDVTADRATLYIPPVDEEDVIWSGLPVGQDEALERWDVDEVKFSSEVDAELTGLAKRGTVVYAIENQVEENAGFLQYNNSELTKLKPAIEQCRVVKDDYEIALMRKANAISDEAHRAVLAEVARGTATNETELEAVFLQACVRRGAKRQAYDTIMATGQAGGTLHYVRNDLTIDGKENLLLDGGCEWNCYASDIVSGVSARKRTGLGALTNIDARVSFERKVFQRVPGHLRYSFVYADPMSCRHKGRCRMGRHARTLPPSRHCRSSQTWYSARRRGGDLQSWHICGILPAWAGTLSRLGHA